MTQFRMQTYNHISDRLYLIFSQTVTAPSALRLPRVTLDEGDTQHLTPRS